MKKILFIIFTTITFIGNAQFIKQSSDVLFPVYFSHTYWNTPSDATTYYFGNSTYPPQLGASSSTISLPYDCTLVAWSYNSRPDAGLSSSENATVSISGTTNYTLSTALSYSISGETGMRSSGLSINFNANDALNMKITTPTWVTNPNGIFQGVTLWFIKR